jgi:hypothetical protein
MVAVEEVVMKRSYENLKAEVRRLREEGRDVSPNVEERANWAYGTTKIENDDVTEEMALEAARATASR